MERLNNFLQGDMMELFSNLGSLTPELMFLMATIYCLYKVMSGINVPETVITVSNSLLSYFSCEQLISYLCLFVFSFLTQALSSNEIQSFVWVFFFSSFFLSLQ